LFHHIISFPLLIASMFCIPLFCSPSLNMHLMPGTPLHHQTSPNSQEFKENSQPLS
jgi:hypothetical protein